MIRSLFEVYDPYTFFLNTRLNWAIAFILFFLFIIKYWVLSTNLFCVINLFIKNLLREYYNFFNENKVGKGGVILFIRLFIYILIINFLGLIPYSFSCSSHFIFAVTLRLPLWLGIIILGWLNFSNIMFCHLIPLGTPLLLIPLMVFIERIRNFIRPWSLRVRLISNLISGHLLIRLLGDCGFSVFFIQISFFIFEFFVCFIQAYVFSTLLTLYSREI